MNSTSLHFREPTEEVSLNLLMGHFLWPWEPLQRLPFGLVLPEPGFPSSVPEIRVSVNNVLEKTSVCGQVGLESTASPQHFNMKCAHFILKILKSLVIKRPNTAKTHNCSNLNKFGFI